MKQTATDPESSPPAAIDERKARAHRLAQSILAGYREELERIKAKRHDVDWDGAYEAFLEDPDTADCLYKLAAISDVAGFSLLDLATKIFCVRKKEQSK